MTVSMHPMQVGSGVAYLLSSVTVGDGNRDLATPLTRYYQEKGNPPGRWYGTGLIALGLGAGEQVTQQALELLVGNGVHPLTGEKIGQAFPKFANPAQRIAARLARLSPSMTETERTAAVEKITAEETARKTSTAVAAFDYTFSVPKSVSTVWAVADAGTQQIEINEVAREVVGQQDHREPGTRREERGALEGHRVGRASVLGARGPRGRSSACRRVDRGHGSRSG
jgi:hypothetical protein